MDETARAARNEYYRRWRAEHPERVQAIQARYWARKAAQANTETETRAAVAVADPDEQAPGLDGN